MIGVASEKVPMLPARGLTFFVVRSRYDHALTRRDALFVLICVSGE